MFLLRPSMAAMSSPVSSKSKMSKFSRARLSLVVRGMAMIPCWISQRRVIWPLVLPCARAISLITGGTDSAYAAEAGSIPDRYIVLFVDTNPLAAVVVLAGTVCAVGAAVMLLRVAKGATRSSKYTTPAARREEIETEIFADYERRKAAEQNEAAVAEPGAVRP